MFYITVKLKTNNNNNSMTECSIKSNLCSMTEHSVKPILCSTAECSEKPTYYKWNALSSLSSVVWKMLKTKML